MKLLMRIAPLVACVAFLAFWSGQNLSAAAPGGNQGGSSSSGVWSTSGPNDPIDLFPMGTPSGTQDGAVTVTNIGPGDVNVKVKDEDGNVVLNNSGEPLTPVGPGNGPTFMVPPGGTLEVSGSGSGGGGASGSYNGSF